MKHIERNLGHLLERADIVGWLSVAIVAAWLLLDVFNVAPPWLVENLPQAVLFVVGLLAIYLHRVLSEIRRHLIEGRPAEVIIGHEEIYEAIINLIQRSPPHARYWATSFLFHPYVKKETQAFLRYFEVLRRKLQSDSEAEYRCACAATTRDGWEILKKRNAELLGTNNAELRYYFENPLVLNCLIGEIEAIIGIPDRSAFPFFRAAIHIRDPRMVASLRQWYQEFIWESPVNKLPITDSDDLVRIEERQRWVDTQQDKAG